MIARCRRCFQVADWQGRMSSKEAEGGGEVVMRNMKIWHKISVLIESNRIKYKLSTEVIQ